jgi:hypothetical protein
VRGGNSPAPPSSIDIDYIENISEEILMIKRQIGSCGVALLLVLGGLVVSAPANGQIRHMTSPSPQVFSSTPVVLSAAGSADPCALVTKPEAEVILGAATTQKARTIDRGHSQMTRTCSYTTASYSGVSVMVTNKADITLFNTNRTMSGGQTTDMPGIGDAAFGSAGGISVLSGVTFFTIQAPGGADALRRLAQEALSRI